MTEFVRGFRLHPRNGPALDGAAFPSGRVFVLDDPVFGFATVAASVEELLRGGYLGARIEWADQALAETPAPRCLTPSEHDRAWHEDEQAASPSRMAAEAQQPAAAPTEEPK
ncbi:hypothetical protein ACN6LM_003883 [Streptomyces sp. SAS_281]|uniref:hypothetical protein n=1 Tax=Streptomyces sp. SAS_281 TaxID=3412744 RepID=UPI00403CE403